MPYLLGQQDPLKVEPQELAACSYIACRQAACLGQHTLAPSEPDAASEKYCKDHTNNKQFKSKVAHVWMLMHRVGHIELHPAAQQRPGQDAIMVNMSYCTDCWLARFGPRHGPSLYQSPGALSRNASASILCSAQAMACSCSCRANIFVDNAALNCHICW